ncbi:hypothetical protein [Candidatus Methylobacter favarea]|nr:hypothetical protein [Candidatus Methylobacter favarea]
MQLIYKLLSLELTDIGAEYFPIGKIAGLGTWNLLSHTLPVIVEKLKNNFVGGYKRNKLTPPDGVETLASPPESSEHPLEEYN